MITISPIGRACGRRIRGGIYAETRLSEDGLPIEYFIIDPPTPIDISQLGLAAVGVKLIEINAANARRSPLSKPAYDSFHHIFDVVGQEFYPFPADYVEETRRLGASRRLPANLDFSRLGPGSRLVLIHARAVIENFSAYPQPPLVQCPKGIDAHTLSPLPEMCAGLWWHDLPGQPSEADGQAHMHSADETGFRSGRSAVPPMLRRIEGGTEYHGYPRPEDVVPIYQHGIFLALPISNLAVIQGGGGKDMPDATERNYQSACKSGLPVYLEEE
jgi:hypothetical protein